MSLFLCWPQGLASSFIWNALPIPLAGFLVFWKLLITRISSQQITSSPQPKLLSLYFPGASWSPEFMSLCACSETHGLKGACPAL